MTKVVTDNHNINRGVEEIGPATIIGGDPGMASAESGATDTAQSSRPEQADSARKLSIADIMMDESEVPLVIEPTRIKLAIGKPAPHEFVRTLPNSSAFVELLDLYDPNGGISGISYLLDPRLRYEIPQYVSIVRIHVYVTAHGQPPKIGIWPIIELDRQGRQSDSAATQQVAAYKARDKWISIAWNKDTKTYLLREGEDALGEPQWPSSARKLGVESDRPPTYQDYINLAYGDRIVGTLSEPRVARLLNRLAGKEK